MTAPSTLGARLYAARQRRRMTQRQLADATGLTTSLISKIERSERPTARLDTLHKLAQALDIQVWELMGRQPGLPAGDDDAAVLALRRAVHGGPEHDGEPRSGEILRGDMPDLWQSYWTGRYTRLTQVLPGALAEARAAVRAENSVTANAVLAETFQVAAALLAHLTYEDLAHVALLRAAAAADRAEDQLLAANVQASQTWVLTRQGLWEQAERTAVDAAAAVEPQLSHATADQLAVWGELLRYGITALMRDGRRSEAEHMQAMVSAAATTLGERRPTLGGVVTFSTTVAGMSAVGIAVATDEPRKALQLAAQVDDISAAPLTVQSRYLLNVAFAQAADWQSQAAIDTMRRADALAPEVMPYQGIAKAIVEELAPRRRRERLIGLSGLAERVGVPLD